MGRRIIFLGALLGLLLFGATGAGAASTLTDPAGDAVGGAADITQFVVTNDADGNITFTFTLADRPTLTDDDLLLVLMDTDKNSSTGFNGIDYGIIAGRSFLVLLKGQGSTFTGASAPTLHGSDGNKALTINRTDLGGTTGFVYAAATGLDSNESADDSVPNAGGATYDLDVQPVLDSLAARFAPAKPKAGKVFRLAATTLSLEDGTDVKADSITCVAKLNGKRLAGRCSWRIPKNAKGKRLVVTLTAHYKGATATFTPWRFRVG